MNDKEINIALGKLFSSLDFKVKKVELGLMQDFLKDAKTLQGKLESITNKAAKLSSDYDKLEKAANNVGVDLDANVKAAAKFVKRIEKL